MVAALLANTGIAITKFVAFLLTGASSMLAEAIHSVADSGNQGLLLLGGRQAKKDATPEHPFGYGRERYIYSFLVAIVLFSVGGLFALYEAYHKFHDHLALARAGQPDAAEIALVQKARRLGLDGDRGAEMAQMRDRLLLGARQARVHDRHAGSDQRRPRRQKIRTVCIADGAAHPTRTAARAIGDVGGFGARPIVTPDRQILQSSHRVRGAQQERDLPECSVRTMSGSSGPPSGLYW